MKYLMSMITIGFAGMVLQFLPIIMGLQLYSGGLETSNTSFGLSINNEKFIFSIILGIGVIIPLFIEFFVEILALYLKGRSRPFANVIVRW